MIFILYIMVYGEPLSLVGTVNNVGRAFYENFKNFNVFIDCLRSLIQSSVGISR
jgi:hypothetical protein